MRTELIKLHRRLGRTIVHVTHDQVEAMTMGERICIMNDGGIVQVGAADGGLPQPGVDLRRRLSREPADEPSGRPHRGRARRAGCGSSCGSLALSLPSDARERLCRLARPRGRSWASGPRTSTSTRSGRRCSRSRSRWWRSRRSAPRSSWSPACRARRRSRRAWAASFAAPIGSDRLVYIDPADIHLFDPSHDERRFRGRAQSGELRCCLTSSRTTKPIIAMAHLAPLPGAPGYDADGGIDALIEAVAADIEKLQDGGVDADHVRQRRRPALPAEGVAGEPGRHERRSSRASSRCSSVPFGVNYLWDPYATVALAVATGAAFAREIFTGVYASDMGLWAARLRGRAAPARDARPPRPQAAVQHQRRVRRAARYAGRSSSARRARSSPRSPTSSACPGR